MDKCPTCGCADVKWKDMEAIEWAIKTLGLDESNEEAIRKAIAGEGRLVLTEINCRTCKYDLSIPPPRCYNCSHFDKWERGQDQGGE